MNITLINPANDSKLQTFRFGVGHLGLAYIASALEASAYKCSVIDAKYHRLAPGEVCKKAIDSGGNIFGIPKILPMESLDGLTDSISQHLSSSCI